jgi:hypothetical protein
VCNPCNCCTCFIRSFTIFLHGWNLTETAAWLYGKGVRSEDTWNSGRLLSPRRLVLLYQCTWQLHLKAPGPLECSTHCSFLLTSDRIAIDTGACSEIFKGIWPLELKNGQPSWHLESQGMLGQGPGGLTLQKNIEWRAIIFSAA